MVVNRSKNQAPRQTPGRAAGTRLAGLFVATCVVLAGAGRMAPAYGQSATQNPNLLVPPIVIYKDYNAWWGEQTDEAVLQSLGLMPDAPAGYTVRPTSDLQGPVPQGAKLVLITSNSYGSLAAASNVNSPATQAHLTQFVQNGGVLVMHLAKNNDPTDGSYTPPFLAPGGISVDEAENAYTTQIAPGAGTHPVVIGPDGVPNTADDVTNAILGQPIEFQTHGTLNLPAGAMTILATASGSPALAEYRIGSGLILVTSYTIEWYDPWEADARPQGQILTNELAYAVSQVRADPAPAPPVPPAPQVQPPTPQDCATLVTFAGLYQMTAEFVEDRHLDHELCHEVKEAAKEYFRGKGDEGDDKLEHYIDKVMKARRKHKHRRLAADDAAVLIRMAVALYYYGEGMVDMCVSFRGSFAELRELTRRSVTDAHRARELIHKIDEAEKESRHSKGDGGAHQLREFVHKVMEASTKHKHPSVTPDAATAMIMMAVLL